ncbi:hypothetical protein CEXT_372121, partial [Caerostris extrusa]
KRIRNTAPQIKIHETEILLDSFSSNPMEKHSGLPLQDMEGLGLILLDEFRYKPRLEKLYQTSRYGPT